MNDLTYVVLLGAGATAVMDLWGLARRPLLGWPVPDHALVGRWAGHMAHGQLRHSAIAKAPPIHAERALGWAVHYLTGVLFAALLVVLAGHDWMQQPTPGAALAVGSGSVVAPFLLMQPAMGAGIAASRTPAPHRARLQSLVTHAVFGAGLYIAAMVLRFTVIS